MEKIIDTPIIEEVEDSFLDYAVSVITDRAIPSVYDGLKPVTRRILWDMYVEKAFSNKPYKKCAEVVGSCMGAYHPHGDSSIYGALVGLSQTWTHNNPLIDFHGNNGSRDGDGPASSRYTECKLSKIAEATLEGINKNAVEFIPNYTETKEEPVLLPGMFPHLLCNATSGIAVGTACSFAPHNLGEVFNAIIAYLYNKNITIDDIITYVPAPDFPTGGVIINQDEMPAMYKTGKGSIKIRGVAEIKGQDIIFTEIPFKVSKEDLAVEIDKCCEKGDIKGISEVRDESNKDGVRFVISCGRGVNTANVLEQLFAQTKLQTSYSVNQVALVGKTPKLLNLLDIIKYYVEHQEEVLYNVTKFEFDKIQNRIHILEGLMKALASIDETIKIIKGSSNTSEAKSNLEKTFRIDEKQSQAIVDMKLGRLAKLEVIELETEKAELGIKAETLNLILTNKTVLDETLRTQLEDFQKKFATARKTEITQLKKSEADTMIPSTPIVISINNEDKVKKIPMETFKPQKRGGKGIKNKDIVKYLIKTNEQDSLICFTQNGRSYQVNVADIPDGVRITDWLELTNDNIVAITNLKNNLDKKYTVFITQQGMVKKTLSSEYQSSRARKSGINAIKLKDNDKIQSVYFMDEEPLMLFSHLGRVIYFETKDIASIGKIAVGVKGINLDADDYVVSSIMIQEDKKLAIFTSDNCGKAVLLTDFYKQNRGGKGILLIPKKEDKTIIKVITINNNDNLIINGDKRTICIAAKDLKESNKDSKGNVLIKDDIIRKVIKV